MPKLSSLLVRDAVVSVDTIEEALQRQVLEGGDLDSALLEFDAVGENVLSAYRAACFGLPPASRDELKGVDPAVLSQFPRELASEFRFVPFRVEGQTLVLAGRRPPTPGEQEMLWEALKRPLAFCIAVEVRVETALALHYGINITTRMRALGERLETRMAGELCVVDPLPPEAESLASSLGLSLDDDDEGGGSVPPPPRDDPTATFQLEGLRGRRARAAPVDVAPVVPLRADSRPGPKGPQRPLSGTVRGPMTREQAQAELEQATVRDEVLEVFFAFARQYFECAVLFAVRDERAFGLVQTGLQIAGDVTTLSLPLARDGTLQEVIASHLSKLNDLRKRPADRALLEAIGRGRSQPSALLPITIRRRVVSLLYGDRNGVPFRLEEIGDLIEVLPSVTRAFERIIRDRKLFALEARKLGSRSRRPSPAGTFARTERPAPPVLVSAPAPAPAKGDKDDKGDKGDGSAGPSKPIKADKPGSALGPAGVAAPPTGVVRSQTVQLTGLDIETRPTIQLPPRDGDAPRARGASRDKDAPRNGVAAGPGVYSRSDLPPVRTRAPRDKHPTRPERPSTRPRQPDEPEPDRAGADPAKRKRGSSAPPPRTLSQPPAGAGSYKHQGVNSEVVALGAPPPRAEPFASGPPAELDSPEEPSPPSHAAPRGALGPAARAERRSSPATQTQPLTPRARRSVDPRREPGEPAVLDVVTVPPEVHEGLAPPIGQDETEVDRGELIIDFADEAERLVDELCHAGPDDEGPFVAALQRLGEPALEALFKRFPGPLWFDRRQSHQRLPAGRDVCAIARALYAFEERSVPYIALLLDSHEADSRLYAAMLASDRVQPELLWPVYSRIFDPDIEVRRVAMESLPHYRNVRGFNEMLKSLRERVRSSEAPPQDRLIALEMLTSLREASSIETLVRALDDADKNLQGPAHRGLVAITGHDFGTATRKWERWYQAHAGEHRAQWLIDGLMHGEEHVRSTAGSELQRLSQVYYGYAASANKRDRERIQQRYREWWDTEGKAQFGR